MSTNTYYLAMKKIPPQKIYKSLPSLNYNKSGDSCEVDDFLKFTSKKTFMKDYTCRETMVRDLNYRSEINSFSTMYKQNKILFGVKCTGRQYREVVQSVKNFGMETKNKLGSLFSKTQIRESKRS